MQATIVFKKIWDAIHEVTETGERRWRYIILEGSSRSSKTRSLLQVYYRYASDYGKKRMSVWRDVAKDCRDTVGHDMAGVYPDMEGYDRVNFHSTKSVYTFPTRSTIEITGTDDANKVHGYQGDVLWLNEPYGFGDSRETFDQLDMRTSEVVFIDWNPKQLSFINELKKDPRTLVIHSTFRDNPFCPPEEKHKILSYQPVARCAIVEQKLLTEQDARAYDLLNNPAGFTTKQIKELQRCRDNEDKNSANDFNWLVYGLGLKGERPNRIFRFTEIPDELYKSLDVPVYYGVDWGAVDPWGILEAKYYDGGLYLHELNYTSENEMRELMSATDRAQIEGSEEGIVTWLFRKLNIDIEREIICDDNRRTKIRALQVAGYQAYKAHKPQGSVVDGIDLLNNLRVYYTASSTNLAHEQENYSRKVDRYGVVLEEPEDLNNHLCDPARYIALHLQRMGIIEKV